MCRSLNLYMKYIYAEYFMVYLLRVRSSGWSLRIILQHGGGGARRMRPLAPPPPCWRLILLDTQAQQYGGGCEVEEREEVDLTWWYRAGVSGSGSGQLSLLLFLNILYPPLFFYHPRRPNANPHMLQLISDEGNHFWTTLTWVSNSWLFFFFHPKLLIGTLAM